jgi:hypothetical protein
MSITATFVGADLGTFPSFRGLVNTPDGMVMACPYGSALGVQKIDPTDWSLTNYSTAGIYTPGASVGWVSAALARNGKVLCNTWAQANLLVMDTNDWTLSSIPASGSQQRGTCLGPDDNWWSSPWAGTSVFRTNPDTLARTSFPISYQPSSHPSSPATTSSAFFRYWGIVPGPAGVMFGTPYSADRILVIKPDAANTTEDPVAYQVQGPLALVTGGYASAATGSQWHYDDGTLIPTGDGAAPAYNKYSGGTLCPISGKIVCMPRRGRALLVIDPALTPAFGVDAPEGFMQEVPLPTAAGAGAGAVSTTVSNYFGGAHLADGRIIGVPFANNSVPIWDGRTETVGFHTIAELSTAGGPSPAESNTGLTSNWYASALLLPNGKTLFSPYGAKRFLTLDVGPDKTMRQGTVLQRWINRGL